MFAHVWPSVLQDANLSATWIDARVPAAVPRWVWALLLVLAATVIGRIGGKVLAAVMQLALVGAAVLVAWQMVRGSLPTVPAHLTAPRACVLEGTCTASAPAPKTAGATAGPQGQAAPASVPLAQVR